MQPFTQFMKGKLILIKWMMIFCLAYTSVGFAETQSLIRPGDMLSIEFLGESGFDAPFPVDRQGNIVLPEVGLITLSGLTIEDAQQLIQVQLSSRYLNTDKLRLTMLSQRLLVTVLGYVKAPGEVDIPGDGSLQMALTAAGGIKPGGQLNKLQIRRGDDITVVDYKQYLDSGNESLIPALQPLDIIFVPSSPLTGNVEVEFDAASLLSGGDAAEKSQSVKIFGEVHKPGSFTYDAEQNIVDMLMRAGGVTRFASVEQIRLITDGDPILFDLKDYLDGGSKVNLPLVAPGATLFVPMKEEEVKTGNRTVYVMGEVFRPGAYEVKGEASFFEILANAGGPSRFARTREIRIIRQNGQVSNFDLQAYTEGLSVAEVPKVAPGDAIFVPEKNDINQTSWLKITPDNAVHVIGAVTQPGRYEWSDEMGLMDLIAESRGPAKDADLKRLTIKRRNEAPVTYDLAAYFKGENRLPLPQLQGGDSVIIPRVPELPSGNKAVWTRQISEESVFVLGQVGVPGRYHFTDQQSFLDVLAAANGPSEQADLRAVRVIHRNAKKVQLTEVDLALYFETGDETLLPALQAGDTIFIPGKELIDYERQASRSVRVMGSLNSPGHYRFNDDMNLLDLLARAGGPTDKANIEDIQILHQGCCEPTTTHFNLKEYLDNPENKLLPIVRSGDTVYLPSNDNGTWSQAMSLVRDFLSIATLLVLLL
ncbi:SLBB domain-containing protein [Marinomonas transparens]|uniref:SLBB domain-containing protein n=1 Tax=Marinomonas transparens TaxID=2795388 RepID=A0A934JLC1_9GAMM|nr:SLBB domain-containing protein [Marinomonas transparens]MBJ7538260.1 SLBB domain-containing protein [Marinomonas transparens]